MAGSILAVGRAGAILLVLASLVGPVSPAVAAAEGVRPAADLPACTTMAEWPTRPVTANVRAAVTRYYRARGLLPVRIAKGTEYVLDVSEQRVGTHYCLNPDGSEAGYTGQVPMKATRAVMVHAVHQPYAETGAAAHFVTVAKSPGRPWRVVGEGTGP